MVTIMLALLAGTSLTYASAATERGPALGTTPVKIDTIIISGNRTTHDFVILSEIELKPGMMADAIALKENSERLESLGLFSHAELYLVGVGNGRTALIINVTELWYIWPGIYLAFDEQDPSRVAYGLILSHENFRGRRENLSVNGRVGYTHGYQFRWKIPYIAISQTDWSLNVEAGDIVEEEPRYLRDRTDIEAQNRYAGAKLGHRFSLETDVAINLRLDSYEFRPINGRTDIATDLSGSANSTEIAAVSFSWSRDTRTYRPWGSSGYVVKAALGTSVALNSPELAYVQPSLEFGGIVSPADRFHIATFFQNTALLGETPLFRQFVLNRDNGIRTAMTRSFEGTWRSTGLLEFRGDIIPLTYVTLHTFDFFQRYAENLKFGISTTLFLDGGVVGGAKEASSNLPDYTDTTDGWEVAYGAGLVVHVPYRDIVRIEAMRSARFPSDGILVRIRIGSVF